MAIPARIVTALVAGPVVLIAAAWGDGWFIVLILATGALAAWELWTLLQGTRYAVSPLLVLLGALVPPLTTAFHSLPILVGGGLLAAVAVVPTLVRRSSSETLLATAVSAAAGLYVGLMFSPPIRLSEASQGPRWLVMIIICTWGCDVAAFLIGRRWGRTRFVPKLSPQKSLEGVIAGIVAAVLIGVAAGFAFDLPHPTALHLSALIGCAAVLGDLVESGFKRWAGAKDSGWIMPGHGGILDRIDSLLLTGFVGSLSVGLFT
jgi:phosphatidate cytidylyltransferase